MIKYLWSAAGYGLIAVPLLITRKRHRSRVEHAGAERSKQKGDADGIVAARTESTCSTFVHPSGFGFPSTMKTNESGQPTFLIAAFSSPSLMRVGDLCMRIKICRRLLD